MNKIEYQKPMAQFVQFSNEDVVTTSGCGQGGNGNMTCPWYTQHAVNDECFVLGERCFWGVFKNGPCGSRSWRDSGADNIGCRKTSIMEACGTASKSGQTWDCNAGWTNFYSEP